MSEWNGFLQEKFHITFNLSAVFIDSWSQQSWNANDQDQQIAFQRETEKLWKFANGNEEFLFRTVDDVLAENQALKAEVKWLNDAITQNISNIMEHLQEHSEQLEDLSGEVQSNSDHMEDINDQLAHMRTAPIGKTAISISTSTILTQIMKGTILAWSPYPDKDTPNPASVPRGWVLCDGSEITEGDWKGQKTPDLNKSKRFLRGGHVGDALTLEEDCVNADQLTYEDRFYYPGTTSCPSGSSLWVSRRVCNEDCENDVVCKRTVHLGGSSSETKPKNMNVVFIMKVF